MKIFISKHKKHYLYFYFFENNRQFVFSGYFIIRYIVEIKILSLKIYKIN